jgi:hypothetical protein
MVAKKRNNKIEKEKSCKVLKTSWKLIFFCLSINISKEIPIFVGEI